MDAVILCGGICLRGKSRKDAVRNKSSSNKGYYYYYSYSDSDSDCDCDCGCDCDCDCAACCCCCNNDNSSSNICSSSCWTGACLTCELALVSAVALAVLDRLVCNRSR